MIVPRGYAGATNVATPEIPSRRAGPWLLDLSLAAIGAYAAILLVTEITVGLAQPARLAAVLLAAVHGGVLVFRRVSPPAVLAVQIATAAGYVALDLPVFMLGPAVLVTLYTVGSRLPRRTAVTLLVAAEVALAVLQLPAARGITTWLQFAGMLLAAWFLGDVTRRWRDAANAHARRAAELEQARDELARLAVTAERLRIARELHDVVAHSMSVIAMHAGSGRLAADRDPAAARRALEVVERSSREALTEMRRLVSVLRDPDDSGLAGSPASSHTRSPAPRLQDVHRLVAEVAAAGVSVDVQTAGDLAAVPDGVSLAAYRIVQEALTNVVRHASPAHAVLTVVNRDGAVVLDVVDDGAPQAARTAPPASAGHGSIGMRERAMLYGGELTTGPHPAGGWRVHARLPYEGVAR
jgi:signal transduction histidine kinase